MEHHVDAVAVNGDTADREIVIARTVNAPREVVFDAWTDPAQVPRWWGPDGFTTTVHEMDVRPGGVWRYAMHGPGGIDYDNAIAFLEVERPDRLVYAHGSDSHSDPEHFFVTVTFADDGGKTRVTLRMVFTSAAQRERTVKYGAVEGGNQTLGRLAAHLRTGVSSCS